MKDVKTENKTNTKLSYKIFVFMNYNPLCTCRTVMINIRGSRWNLHCRCINYGFWLTFWQLQTFLQLLQVLFLNHF